VGLPAIGTSAAEPAPVCVDGFSLVAPTAIVVPEDVYALKPGKAILAGSYPGDAGKRVARIARYQSASGWNRAASMAVGTDSGFVALGGTSSSRLWAVGYSQGYSTLAPLVARQKPDGSWKRASIGKPARNATLTDVSASTASRAWAVGYRLDAQGRQLPWAAKWLKGKWSSKSPGLRPGERGALTGVSVTPHGGTWAVGSVMRGGVERFYMAHRVGSSWKRRGLDRFGQGTLTAIAVPDRQTGWAVGYRTTTAGPRALVLRWNGSSWQEVEAPSAEGSTVLLDVSVDSSGNVAISGSTWKLDPKRMRGMVAEREGSSWNTHYAKVFGQNATLTGVDGDPADAGWVVGRDLLTGIAAKTCTPEALGISSAKAKKTKKARQAERKRRQAALATATALAADGEPHITERLPAPQVGLATVPKLQIAAAGGVTIRDKAKAVGLPTKARTYGAVVRDFNGDKRPDIFLGGHAGAARLYLDKGAQFKASGTGFGAGDRHTCAAADVDGSGLPDLYCNFGGGRGLGVKANQLWLDPGGPNARLDDDAGGAVEPLGRGRGAVFLDVDKDGRKDLVLGQQPDRVDGLPSLNAVYLRNGTGSFRLWRKSGLSTDVGGTAFDSGDVDRDGRTDLLLMYRRPRASGNTSGTRLLRNTRSGLRDVTAAWGIKSIGERDAELVRLDGDNKLDLVQLSRNRIRISLQRNNRFVKVYERSLSNAVAVAAGDADGDGDRDLYILRQKNSSSTKDLILFNYGGGRSYRAVSAPSRSGGTADDVYPIDHDKNGLTDFLVLNGRGSGKGPLQLISFYR